MFIVIIPFVFWGMGDVFNSGNTNSLAKINNSQVSTQDLMEYINSLNVNQDIIKDRIDENILEEILSGLISDKLLDLEIASRKIILSDKMLAQRLKRNKNFLDESNKFSRLKYEKFLISNNYSASIFEQDFKKKEMQSDLFKYLGSGIKVPFFLINNIYKNQEKDIDIEFINLEKIYKSKEQFNESDIADYIKNNKKSLEKDYVNFIYAKITPNQLIGLDEYNDEYFNKIDEIENKISNNLKFNEIVRDYNLTTISKKDFLTSSSEDKIENRIYNLRDGDKIRIIDEGDYFLLYKIEKVTSSIPNIKNSEFLSEVKELLFRKNKFELNKKILKKINEGKFLENDFKNVLENKTTIEKLKLTSINDTDKFTSDSLKLIYSLPEKSYTLISDNNKNIYLIKILNHKIENMSDNDEIKKLFNMESKNGIKNQIFESYDMYLNTKYEIKINEKTLDRVKNYFR